MLKKPLPISVVLLFKNHVYNKLLISLNFTSHLFFLSVSGNSSKKKENKDLTFQQRWFFFNNGFVNPRKKKLPLTWRTPRKKSCYLKTKTGRRWFIRQLSGSITCLAVFSSHFVFLTASPKFLFTPPQLHYFLTSNRPVLYFFLCFFLTYKKIHLRHTVY